MPGSKTPLAVWEVRNVVSTNPCTTNFRHLLPLKKSHLKRVNSEGGPRVKIASAHDRIKWWNIVPGDQVRVIADKDSPIREVLAVNKIGNRVYLKSDKKEGAVPKNPLKRQNPSKNIHYSGVQLYMGNYDFPTADGKPQNVPVFARRLGTTDPHWDGKKWAWNRFAVATTPRLPSWMPGQQTHYPIPWPEQEKPVIAEPTPYDTPKEVVAEVTYQSAPVQRDSSVPILPAGLEDTYIEMLRGTTPYDPAQPFELLPARELANPHSRTRKRVRYLSVLAARRALLRTMVQEELADLRGRTRSAARADAVFRWHERVREERKQELKRRWVQRGAEARMERRQERRRKSVEKETRRLAQLVLAEAPNQVVPPTQAQL